MEETAYWGLFLAAFTSATLLPAQSEMVLSGLLLTGKGSVCKLIAVASLANTLGSSVNWLLGRYFNHLREKPWFPIKAQTLARAEGWYRKYGRWSLLLSWMPLVGDPLTLVAGILREPFHSFLFLVAVAKTARYLAVAGIVLQWA